MNYNVSVLASTVVDLGNFEADSREEAYEKAMQEQRVRMWHYISMLVL